MIVSEKMEHRVHGEKSDLALECGAADFLEEENIFTIYTEPDDLSAVCDAVNVPVIASGGAGKIEDFVTLFKTLPKVDAGLAASIFHFGDVKISDLKAEMAKKSIPTRI